MEPWIGLAHVKPREGNETILEGASGAFTSVLALSLNEDHFLMQATSALQKEGFDVIGIDDIEPLPSREHVVDDEIRRLGESLNADSPVLFSTFDAYESE